MSKEATKRAVATQTELAEALSNGQTASATHEKIAVLAYELWQQRGCPEGCPEEDWFRAEQQLTTSK